jgi:thiamine-phosphate pyrophosphorylase
MRLLLLTDRSQLRLGRGLERTVLECLDAGLTHVVLRELDLPDAQRAALAGSLAAAGVTVIAAHRPVAGAAGLQLPAGGSNTLFGGSNTPSSGVAARPDRLLPPSTACYSRGRSCHSRADVEAAAAAGFDYATLGPFAATASKPGYGPPLPPEEYADLPLPTYALGGIDIANAEAALAAGARGIAVMGTVMRAASPASVVRDLLGVIG